MTENYKYVLGIDIGTTSVKVNVIESKSSKIVEEYTNQTDCYIVHDNTKSEQSASKIVNSLNHCMFLIPEKILEQVIGIGVSGQMHGVICWSSKNKPWNSAVSYSRNIYEVDQEKVSPHYDWQDNRCESEFLSSLPKPDSHLTIHTGYGCCTIFWLIKRDNVTFIEDFDCSSTIADFIVAMLCDLDKPLMHPQNAASWGYFNTLSNSWNTKILKNENFPVHLLPKISSELDNLAGSLKFAWHCIPASTPVGIALGDLQSQVLVNLNNSETNAVCNISTSAQMVYLAKNFHPDRYNGNSYAKIVPYFEKEYLYEAAILNGGNAVSLFVSHVLECLQFFGCSIDKDKLWKQLIELGGLESSQSDLIFYPTFLGERYSPKSKASIHNITMDNLKLAPVFRALCKGVISNLQHIAPSRQLHDAGITKIVGTGTALLRNKILQQELENQYSLPVEYRSSGDSAYGAAVYILQILNSNKHQEEFQIT